MRWPVVNRSPTLGEFAPTISWESLICSAAPGAVTVKDALFLIAPHEYSRTRGGSEVRSSSRRSNSLSLRAIVHWLRWIASSHSTMTA